MLVVFEGIDGCGKSSQLQSCSQWLTGLGIGHVVCHDPGTTGLGEKVRSLLLDSAGARIDPVAEMFLFMAARAQLASEIILPAMNDGRLVLSDRLMLSTIVYQGYANSVPLEDIRAAGRAAMSGISPDLTIIFDVPVATAAKRMGNSRDRMESRGDGFYEKVRNGFLQEARRDPVGIRVIDATVSEAEVQQQVRQLVSEMLEGNR